MKLLLIADTHVPKRAKVVPDQIWRAVNDADVVVHAGDWIEVSFLDQLEQRSNRLIGVYGNNDDSAIRSRLPERVNTVLEGVRIGVIHETGPSQKRETRCDEEWPETDVLVFGHSHIPWDSTTPNGLRLLNPGSPTDRRRQPRCTYMTCNVASGKLTDVELHSLPLN